jgi:hypothetical protein
MNLSIDCFFYSGMDRTYNVSKEKTSLTDKEETAGDARGAVIVRLLPQKDSTGKNVKFLLQLGNGNLGLTS